ncbi:sulfotransferase family 2 domain-containing protein [Caldovatus aquaticus]|uniref:Sulfotransferase family protein n=1 Tax=Caldovatus aquaticus TaxID=2865671 RepID=A0ABS7F3K7_9PROT|nr:sulfotransferase family 2 domain-containing protein [Caldovatus aquaticus]MBW8270189.1 sulfotransferase family protein [Caldovatus aquaticus]
MIEVTKPDASIRVGANRKLAFVHIPKTAGTSFTIALKEFWSNSRVIGAAAEIDHLAPSEVHDLDLIAGHFFPYQLDAEIFAPFTRATLLRDPFERFFSSYRFARTWSEQGVDTHDWSPAMQYIAKVSFGEYAFSRLGWSDRHAQIYILGRDHTDAAERMPLRELFDRAKRCLENMLVGTVDHIQDYLWHVLRRHGIEAMPQIGRHMVSKAYSLEEVGLTRAQEAALREVLQPDFALYSYARDLMLRRIEADARSAA